MDGKIELIFEDVDLPSGHRYGNSRCYGKSQFEFDVPAYDNNKFEEFLSESEPNNKGKFAARRTRSARTIKVYLANMGIK